MFIQWEFAMLYPTRSKMWNSDRAKAPGLADRKPVRFSNIDRLARELSRRPQSTFLTALGIRLLARFCSMLLLLIMPLALNGGGVTLYEIGTSEVRLASAGWSSRANEPSTVFTNPAGMSRLNRRQLQFNGEAIYLHVDFDHNSNTSVRGTDGHSNEWLPAGSFFYVQPINDDITLGFGNLGYFGSCLRFNNDWVGRYRLTYNFLEGFSLVPAAAYKINDYLSVGVGVNIMYGLYRQKSDVNNLLDSMPDGRLRLIDEDFGYGAVVGILFEPSACTRFGVQYLSRVNLRFRAKPKFSGIGPVLTDILDRTGVLNSKVKISSNVPQSVMVSGYHDLNDFGRPQACGTA